MRYGSEIIMCIGVVTPILLSMTLSYNVRCDDTGTKYTSFIRRITRITIHFWGKFLEKSVKGFHSLYSTVLEITQYLERIMIIPSQAQRKQN